MVELAEGRAGALGALPGQVDAGEPGGQGVEVLAVDAQVHGGGVDPQRQRAPGPLRA
jgi:hypothetical protein